VSEHLLFLPFLTCSQVKEALGLDSLGDRVVGKEVVMVETMDDLDLEARVRLFAEGCLGETLFPLRPAGGKKRKKVTGDEPAARLRRPRGETPMKRYCRDKQQEAIMDSARLRATSLVGVQLLLSAAPQATLPDPHRPITDRAVGMDRVVGIEEEAMDFLAEIHRWMDSQVIH
jgi:hypothetical protein